MRFAVPACCHREYEDPPSTVPVTVENSSLDVEIQGTPSVEIDKVLLSVQIERRKLHQSLRFCVPLHHNRSVPDHNDEIAALEVAALDLLRQIVSEAHGTPGGDGPIEIGFNYRHANNIVWLAEELLSSIEEGHVASPPIIARSMLESLFNLAAATSIDHFPARKIVWELRDYLARLKSFGLDHLLGDKQPEVIALIDRLESQYGLPNERGWSIARIARESETTEFLRKEYFLLSGHTHSSSFALLGRDDGIYANLIHQTVISCLLMAAGFAAQLIPTNDPQAHIDRVTELGKSHLDLISRGAFDLSLNED